MSEIASSGNLVNALNSVRDDYHEHLKSIPQYEAFLLIESSTQRVFETLDGLADSPARSTAAEVISSLEIAKAKFKQHLTGIPEYRALLAIEKLISDVSVDLGVAQSAAAQIVLAGLKQEIPPEVTPQQPEPDLAEPTTGHEVAQPEPAEIAATDQATPTQTEPDLAAPVADHPVTEPEAAAVASTEQFVATEPEPDFADSTSEQAASQPEDAEVAAIAPTVATQAEPDPDAFVFEDAQEAEAPVVVASTQRIAATHPEPDRAVPAFEHTVALAAEIASTHLMPTTRPDPDLAGSVSEYAATRPWLAEIDFATPTAQNESLSDPILAADGGVTTEPVWDTAPAAIEDLYDLDEPPAAPDGKGSERAA
jgi:hypothetical protein